MKRKESEVVRGKSKWLWSIAEGEGSCSRRGPDLEKFPAAGEDQQDGSMAVSGL